MNNLPKIGDRVRVWPAPERLVQDGPRTLDAGGRWLAKEGREVAWSYFHLEQYRAGDLYLHDPAPSAAPEKTGNAGEKE
jgi:hypothetical protein